MTGSFLQKKQPVKVYFHGLFLLRLRYCVNLYCERNAVGVLLNLFLNCSLK